MKRRCRRHLRHDSCWCRCSRTRTRTVVVVVGRRQNGSRRRIELLALLVEPALAVVVSTWERTSLEGWPSFLALAVANKKKICEIRREHVS
jgi:hypothetical protein